MGMQLIAKLLTAALGAGQAQDLSFELSLTNDSDQPVKVCAKDIPWTNALGYHGFGAAFTSVAAPTTKPRGVFRPFNPAWGPPAPPYLAAYLDQHVVSLAPRQTVKAQVNACVLPRVEVPKGQSAAASALGPPENTDISTLALVVFETRCADLRRALSKERFDTLYGRPLALVAHGEHDLAFNYVESAGFGFTPPQPLRLFAPPLRVRIP